MEYDQRNRNDSLRSGDLPRVLIPDRRELLLDWDVKKVSQGIG
jgi:hypothetical protein